jgi:Zn-dependent alcohol dehydrogenase
VITWWPPCSATAIPATTSRGCSVCLYQSGNLKLDELITRTYSLEDVNLGYEDLLAGRNTRGVLVLD